jgi:crotonobetainyl-CoA:carnitine CoA-transferase CaiB-like acyl-CoA transferase
VIEYSMNGRVQQREGNRSRVFAPQGVYPCKDGAFVACSVRGDAEWQELVRALGDPAWAASSELASAEARRQRAHEIDEQLAAWTADREASEVAELLRARGIPAAQLLTAPGMYGEPQLEARNYYLTLEHPVTGKRRYPVWPMRFSFQTGPVYPRATATLGQHNDEILGGELGLAAPELARLREQGVIGEQWKPPEA